MGDGGGGTGGAGGGGAAGGGGEPVEDAAQDAARAALNRARAAARARGHSPAAPGRGPGRAGAGRPGTDPGGRSGRAAATAGARPDARDPQPVAGSIGRLVHERGWSEPVAVGGVMGRWAQVVGRELAEHCTPERFEEGVLEVRADSTTWATQVRLLTAVVMRRLEEDLGTGVVQKLVVRGPVAPSWHRGARAVSDGRGPRDTYG